MEDFENKYNKYKKRNEIISNNYEKENKNIQLPKFSFILPEYTVGRKPEITINSHTNEKKIKWSEPVKFNIGRQLMYNVNSAYVALADYNLLKNDIPDLRNLSNSEIDIWLLERAGIMSEGNVKDNNHKIVFIDSQNENFILKEKQNIHYVRPPGYGRGVVMIENLGKPNEIILDMKGIGIGPYYKILSNQNNEIKYDLKTSTKPGEPIITNHADGVFPYNEALMEFFSENIVRTITNTSPIFDFFNIRTVKSYAVINLGIKIKNRNDHAAVYVRQSSNRKIDSFNTDDKKFVQSVLSYYGISAFDSYGDYTFMTNNINLQGTDNIFFTKEKLQIYKKWYDIKKNNPENKMLTELQNENYPVFLLDFSHYYFFNYDKMLELQNVTIKDKIKDNLKQNIFINNREIIKLISSNIDLRNSFIDYILNLKLINHLPQETIFFISNIRQKKLTFNSVLNQIIDLFLPNIISTNDIYIKNTIDYYLYNIVNNKSNLWLQCKILNDNNHKINYLKLPLLFGYNIVARNNITNIIANNDKKIINNDDYFNIINTVKDVLNNNKININNDLGNRCSNDEEYNIITQNNNLISFIEIQDSKFKKMISDLTNKIQPNLSSYFQFFNFIKNYDQHNIKTLFYITGFDGKCNEWETMYNNFTDDKINIICIELNDDFYNKLHFPKSNNNCFNNIAKIIHNIFHKLFTETTVTLIAHSIGCHISLELQKFTQNIKNIFLIEMTNISHTQKIKQKIQTNFVDCIVNYMDNSSHFFNNLEHITNNMNANLYIYVLFPTLKIQDILTLDDINININDCKNLQEIYDLLYIKNKIIKLNLSYNYKYIYFDILNNLIKMYSIITNNSLNKVNIYTNNNFNKIYSSHFLHMHIPEIITNDLKKII
jgi:hypothetical protein